MFTSIIPTFRQSTIIISHQVQQQRRTMSAIDSIAENKIAEWLRNRGDEGLTHKGKLLSDRHSHAARTFGVGADYLHSKILADNNIKPDSVQRRIELDSEWTKLKAIIRETFEKSQLTVDEFVQDKKTKDQFGDEMDRLDRLAKSLNDAIISDSMRFNGRSPVKHARRFKFDDHLREAL